MFICLFVAYIIVEMFVDMFVEICSRILFPPVDFQWRVMSWRRAHDMQCRHCLGLTDGVSSFSAHTQGEGRAL